jgi:hypothetical protein
LTRDDFGLSTFFVIFSTGLALIAFSTFSIFTFLILALLDLLLEDDEEESFELSLLLSSTLRIKT